MKSKKSLTKLTKIVDIDDLREHAIQTIEQLSAGTIDVDEAGVRGKLYEGVLTTVKSQLIYAKLVGREPHIPFLGDCVTDVPILNKSERKKLYSSE